LLAILMIMHTSPPPPVVTSAQAAASAEQKIAQVEQAVNSGQPATLRMDESELNSYLASHLDISPNGSPNASHGGAAPPDVEQVRSAVKDVKVQLIDDRVRAYVVFDFHGKDMTLQLEGKLGSEDGFLRFEPVSGQIGSMPIPKSSLETAVRHMMESPENREKLRLPAEMSGLKVENGEVVASYK
jgi:ligand-binding sensor domain-containing protein